MICLYFFFALVIKEPLLDVARVLSKPFHKDFCKFVGGHVWVFILEDFDNPSVRWEDVHTS